MSGFTRDLGVDEPWKARLHALGRAGSVLEGAVETLPRAAPRSGSVLPRALRRCSTSTPRFPPLKRSRACGTWPRAKPWEMSLGRSRARRRAGRTALRPHGVAREKDLPGRLVALTAGPTAGTRRRHRDRPGPGHAGRAHDDDRTPHPAHDRQRRPPGAAAAEGPGIKVDGVYGPRNRSRGARVPGQLEGSSSTMSWDPRPAPRSPADPSKRPLGAVVDQQLQGLPHGG